MISLHTEKTIIQAIAMIASCQNESPYQHQHTLCIHTHMTYNYNCACGHSCLTKRYCIVELRNTHLHFTPIIYNIVSIPFSHTKDTSH